MITFNIDWILVLQFALATVLPLAVGIVTTKVTAPNVKAVVLAFFALLAGIGTEILNALVNATPYDVGAGLLTAGASFIVAVAIHFGVWSRPNKDGVSVADRVAEVGRTAN